MTKIIVIDNYDSFVYNLVHYLEEFNAEVQVRRNDKVTIEEISNFDKILLSPGPGIPEEAGLLKKIIETYAEEKPILGVCLGQQAIMEVFGGKLINLAQVHHGVATEIEITDETDFVFKHLPNKIMVGRYHSWVVDPVLPDSLLPTSVDENGQIMSLKHKTFDIRGLQFHPESVLTPEGKQMIKNWVEA